jgi:hypothetical protein
VRLTLQETEQVIRRRLVRRRARWYASGAAAAALLPILLAGLAQAYVRYALPELRWVSLSWRENGVPVYLSFAFWEWATCLVLSLYTLVVLLVAQQTSPRLYGKGELDQ